MARLGDILVAQGAINREVLESHTPRAKDKIGRSLRAHSLVSSRALANALATHQQLPLFHFSMGDAVAHSFNPRHVPHYVQHQYLPLQQHGDRLPIVTPDPSPELQTTLEDFYHMPIEMLVVSGRDFIAMLGQKAASTLTRTATLGLRRAHKSLVADRVLIRPQLYGLGMSIALLLAAFTLDTTTTWNALLIGANLFYVATILFKLQLLMQGRMERNIIARDADEIAAIISQTPEDQWPSYTILVPMYHERYEVVSRLIGHLLALDYPREKLSIKLVCEADDATTLAAIKAFRPPENISIIRVPPSFPRTKPKACNVALQQIRSDYLVIFDAEDAPDPQQLKRAAAMFMHLPADIACLQTPLNYYNYHETLLTRLFAIEYSALFRLTLPAMQRMQLPIPLGGTSNHIRTAILQKLGGWDAFNVTEDADLGLRLAYFGYRTRLLPSITLEESPIHLHAWMRQRSRWIKGYIQTWLVYMRNPRELQQRLGARAYHGFQFFIGAPILTFLVAPIFWGALMLHVTGIVPSTLSPLMKGICTTTLVSGIATQLLFAASAVRFEQWRGMGAAILLYPAYWMLHSVASLWALWQLAFNPHKWEKTRHGESRVFE